VRSHRPFRLALALVCGLWICAAPRAAGPLVLGVGAAPGSAVYLQVDIARALGYFEREKLELKILNFRGGAVAGAALVGGSVDVSANALDHAVKAQHQGKKVRLIASFTHLPALPLVVGAQHRSSIRGVADLKGRPVGVTAPGSASDLLMRFLFVKAGLDPREARIIGVGTNTMPAAIEHGQVHAAIGTDPWVTEVVRRGTGFVLVDLRTERATREVFGGPYQLTGLLATAEVVERKADELQRLVNAVARANRWMSANPVERWADLLPEEAVGDRTTFIASMKASREIFSADSTPRRDGVVNLLRTFDVTGQVPGATRMSPDELIDLRFVTRVPSGG
jgi:NitT/TauT family transport system substrate-binding protein